MSEHYDFHYQPTGSGAISGQQVLEQTEDAINELGDYVNDNVGGAMDVAQEALETAQNAQNDAQTALDTANSFSSAIQSAQQDANTALSTAQTAQTTASNANNTAIQASQDANTAVTTANNASGQVSTLSGTVTTLGQRVTTAEGNIGQNTSDITALTSRVGTAEGNITTLQNDVTIAQGNASSAMATAGTVKQQSYVLRYSSTTLVASSTNSNALLDNTDNLKVGDKVIDSSGVIYSVTAIDTANSTFTIGTSLIDLAQDSDVVHKSGDETVGGLKTFENNRMVVGRSTDTGSAIQIVNADVVGDSANGSSGFEVYGSSISNDNKIGGLTIGEFSNNGGAYATIEVNRTVSGVKTTTSIRNLIRSDGSKEFSPSTDNDIKLGHSSFRWSKIYGTEYYYGSNNVEFSTKFVTTDTNQTISGVKTFSDNPLVGNNNTNITISNRQVTANSSYSAPTGSSYSFMQLKAIVNYADSSPSIDATVGLSIQENAYSDGKKSSFSPNSNNTINLGLSGKRWANVYGTNYYYGSSEIEFSQKFVTTDTNQTVSGSKTFSSNVNVYNSDSATDIAHLVLKNQKAEKGGSSSDSQIIYFTDNLTRALATIRSSVGINGQSILGFRADNIDSNNNAVYSGFSINSYKNGTKNIAPNTNGDTDFGTANAKWKSFNGLEPSSLSLPSGNVSDVIDISSYITALDGTSNSYTVPANGWISIAVVGTAIAIVSSSWSDSRLRASSGNVRMLYPVLKNETLAISVTGTTLTYARFIPCQGNV